MSEGGRLILTYVRDDDGEVVITTRIPSEDLEHFIDPYRSLLAAIGFTEHNIKELLGE